MVIGVARAVATRTITAGGGTPFSFTRQIAASTDDAEETPVGGTVWLDGSDIELCNDSNGSVYQLVFLRFLTMDVAASDTVDTATIRFTSDEVHSTAVTVRIFGADVDNVGTATLGAGGLSALAKTTAFVDWSIPSWGSTGLSGTDQTTPNLKSIVDEITARAGWAQNNAIAFLIQDQSGTTTRRVAVAYDTNPAQAAVLSVDGSR